MLKSLRHSWYMILSRRSLSLVYIVTEVCAHLFHLFCRFKQCVPKYQCHSSTLIMCMCKQQHLSVIYTFALIIFSSLFFFLNKDS